MSASPTADARPLVVACLRITDLRPGVDPADRRRRTDDRLGHRPLRGRRRRPRARPAGRRGLVGTGAGGRRRPRQPSSRCCGTCRPWAPPCCGSRTTTAAPSTGTRRAGRRRAGRWPGPWPPPWPGSARRPWWCAATARSTGAPVPFPPFWPTSSGPPRRWDWWPGVDPSSGGRDPVDDARLRSSAERRLDGGWRERLRVPLPAVCSVEGAGIRLRRASLDGALSAAAAPVPVEPPTPSADQPTPLAGPGSGRPGSARPAPVRAPDPGPPAARRRRPSDPAAGPDRRAGGPRPADRDRARSTPRRRPTRCSASSSATATWTAAGRRIRPERGRPVNRLADTRPGPRWPGRRSRGHPPGPAGLDRAARPPSARSPPTPTSPWPSPSGAARRSRDLVVAPPLAYGSSGEHQGFAGTLSIGQEATELVLVELGRSASRAFAHADRGLDPRRQRRAVGAGPWPGCRREGSAGGGVVAGLAR